jgi:phosphoribosylformylglycinamidine synthase
MEKSKKFKASLKVMLKESVLDPQGAALERALKSMGHTGILSVRVGKHIEIVLEEEEAGLAEAKALNLAEELLANPVMETYALSLEKAK